MRTLYGKINMRALFRIWNLFGKNNGGVTAIQYGLIASVIGLGVVAGATEIGGNTQNTLNTVTKGINPNFEFEMLTYENVSNLFDEAGASNSRGCNGLGRCGWGTAKAFADEFLVFAAESNMDTSNIDVAQIARIRARATGYMNSIAPNVSTGFSELGETPTVNTEGYNQLRGAARQWLEQCDASCYR